MNRTALASATGLSYDRLIRYLDWMTEKGFVRLDEDGQVRLTSVGSEAYDGIVRWIVDHVGSLKLFPAAVERCLIRLSSQPSRCGTSPMSVCQASGRSRSLRTYLQPTPSRASLRSFLE